MRRCATGRPLAPLLTNALPQRRRGKIGRSWYVDETDIKVADRWQYLYRAIDTDVKLADVYLSAPRDQAAAEAFFRSAIEVTGIIPEAITTDKHADYPPAIDDGVRGRRRAPDFQVPHG